MVDDLKSISKNIVDDKPLFSKVLDSQTTNIHSNNDLNLDKKSGSDERCFLNLILTNDFHYIVFVIRIKSFSTTLLYYCTQEWNQLNHGIRNIQFQFNKSLAVFMLRLL